MSFLDAVKNGELEKVKKYVEENINILEVKSDGLDAKTALTFAAWRGHLEIVEYLVSKGANVNAIDPVTGHTPLLCAAQYGHGKIVTFLLSQKANAYVTMGENEDNALILTVDGNTGSEYVDCAERLLAHDSKIIDYQNKEGKNALCFAIEYRPMFDVLLQAAKKNKTSLAITNAFLFVCSDIGNYLQAFQKLLQNGANINAVDKENNSALDLILTNDDLKEMQKAIQLLLSATPAFDEELQKATAKKIAADRKKFSEEKIALLKKVGFKIPIAEAKEEDLLDKEGNSPLMVAIIKGEFNKALSLIENADPNRKNNDKQSPLYLAVHYYGKENKEEHVELIKALIKAGADPNEKMEGTNLLIKSIHNKSYIAETLIEGKANVNAVDRLGRTPLITAAKLAMHDVVAAILKKDSSSLNVQEQLNQETALFSAVLKGQQDSAKYTKTIELLINAGADPYISSGTSKLTGASVFSLSPGIKEFGEKLNKYKEQLEAKKTSTEKKTTSALQTYSTFSSQASDLDVSKKINSTTEKSDPNDKQTLVSKQQTW